jgi:hypothetical protein
MIKIPCSGLKFDYYKFYIKYDDIIFGIYIYNKYFYFENKSKNNYDISISAFKQKYYNKTLVDRSLNDNIKEVIEVGNNKYIITCKKLGIIFKYYLIMVNKYKE